MSTATVLEDRLEAALHGCEVVSWRRRRTPAEELARLGAAAEELGLDEWDGYGAKGAVARVETEVAGLLGKPAAVLFPSGVMGQQAALRTWCDRSGSTRVAMPDVSHLLRHEDDGPRLLHDLRVEHLTHERRVALAADLAARPPGLGAVLVELPLRAAGCALPTWQELTELSEAARAARVPLHVDGARLWESQPFYDRPLHEIAALADTVYVSLYKGLGAMSGALVAGPEDVAEELRLWRHRMGGTLWRLTPYAVGGLVGLRDLLPLMGQYVAWARALAGELGERGLRVLPDPPHTNTFQVYAEGTAEQLSERLVSVMERERVAPCHPWGPADVPGFSLTEIAVHEAALERDPAAVAGWFEEMLG